MPCYGSRRAGVRTNELRQLCKNFRPHTARHPLKASSTGLGLIELGLCGLKKSWPRKGINLEHCLAAQPNTQVLHTWKGG